MPKRSVSAFFKRMFDRGPQTPESQHTCHQCECRLSAESMGPRILERCPECRGIWISHAQLTEILEQVSHKVEDDLQAVESDGHADIGHTLAPSRLARGCPACSKSMDNFKFEETGVWVDACPDHHGIWLDRGELRLLAQRTQSKPEYDTGEVMDAVSDLILGSL